MTRWLIMSSVASGLLALPAWSQTTDAADTSRATGAGAAPETARATNQTSNTDGVEDIVVTARRQQETLIDVPVAVSALTARKLDALGLQQFKEVANFSPGIIINATESLQSRIGSQIIIRGVTPSLAATSSVFIDGVPVSSGVVEGVDDVARVEILRGPQTVFFGRQVFAGAINFVTKTPDMQSYKGRAEASFDDHALADLRAQVEGPIIRDKISLRLAGRYFNRHGTRDNAAGGRLGDQQTKLLAGALRFTPTERLSVNLYGFFQRDKDGPSVYRIVSRPNFNCNAGAAPTNVPNYICGLIPNEGAIPLGANLSQADIAGFLPIVNRTAYGTAATPVFRMLRRQPLDEGGLRARVEHAHGAAEYDADIVKLSVLAGYNRKRVWALTDLDFRDSTPFPNPTPVAARQPGAPNINNALVRREDYSTDYFVEARAATDVSKPIRAIVGVSYLEQRNANLVTVQLASGTVLTGGLGAINRVRTPAVFGSVSWDIVPELTVSAEGRYQTDKVDAFRRSAFTSTKGTILVNGASIPTVIAAAKYKNFTPRVIAQYRPIPGTMVYASYAEGVNPGTFNTSLLNFDASFQARAQAQTGAGVVVNPEKLKSSEIGIKSQFWDNKAQVSVAVYRAIWVNQIVNQTYTDPLPPFGTGQGTTLNTNIGKTLLRGIELEGTVRPIPQLEFTGALAYNGSKIKQYACIPCQAFAGPTVSVIGNSLARAPRWTGAVSAQFTQPVGDDLDAYLRGDLFYKGSIYADETNVARTHPQRVANFRVGVQNSTFRIEGFVTNAFNNRAPTGVNKANDSLSADAVLTNPQAFRLGVPELRRVGVRVAYNFGS